MFFDNFNFFSQSKQKNLDDTNARIIRDLTKYDDGLLRGRLEKIKNDLILWELILLIYQLGSFKEDLQLKVSSRLGDKVLNSIKSFFELYSKNELNDQITTRLKKIYSALFADFPNSSAEIQQECLNSAKEIISH